MSEKQAYPLRINAEVPVQRNAGPTANFAAPTRRSGTCFAMHCARSDARTR